MVAVDPTLQTPPGTSRPLLHRIEGRLPRVWHPTRKELCSMATSAIPRPIIEDLRAFGKPLEAILEWVGDLGLFFWRVARAMFSRPLEGAEFLRQLDAIGAKSLPLAAMAGAAT